MLKIDKIIKVSLLAASAMVFSGLTASAETQSVYPLEVAVGRAYSMNFSDDGYSVLSEVEYPAIYLMNDSMTMYPNLSKTLDDVNAYRLENAAKVYDDLASYVAEDLANGYIDSGVTYTSSDKIKVRRADSSVCSLLFEGFAYTGGTENVYYAKGENYDAQTGQLIFLTDVVSDPAGFIEVVQAQVNSLWAGNGIYSETAVSDYYANTEEIDLSWTLDYNGVTVFFNPYDIAPYSGGIINVTVPFADYPELFYGNYQETCDSYAITLTNEQSFFFDVDNDGYLDNLYICGNSFEEGSYDTQVIYLNGVEYSFSSFFFRMNPMLVHLANGANYLYIEASEENDYREIFIYDLSQGDVQQLAVYGAGLHSYPEFDAYITNDAFTNPESFILEERSAILGTRAVNRYYHVGEDGLPVANEEYYAFNTLTDHCLKQSIVADWLDDNGNVCGTVTLGEGSYVRPVRTDIESVVDLMMEDGGYCRVYIDTTSWPHTIDGVDVTQVFDGLIFAG